jgi:acetoin utilization deacetylase AcuC-like enzyme
MRVIFHKQSYGAYAADPAAASGRMEAMVRVLGGEFEFVEPEPALEEDLERVHGEQHVRSVKRDSLLYETAILAAGGAILAGEMAFSGEPAFGLIRPPEGIGSDHDNCLE